PIGDVVDSREPQLLASIVGDLRIINGQRGKVAIFKLDDKSGAIEATADEALINQHRHTLKDDELIVVQALAQPDRFSGGLRLKIQHIWDLPAARCRFGKYLRVAVNGQAPAVSEIVREFPPRREQTEQGDLVRGLPVRLRVLRPGAQCELQLDDRSLFFPTDAALASWMAQAHERQAEIVFD
ncbi:MAG: DNA polymerase III subunit alpha, partial [Hydrogenophaga sp.]|nr:DNA polymerase III subunit alpha [Hydrogenophaga sp.]